MSRADRNEPGPGHTSKPHAYDYPRPAVTADCAVFGLDGERLHVLLIQRDVNPFRGSWALPGGFVQEDETCEEAARRELAEEAGLRGVYLEQLYTFSDVDRDPRHRVITVAHVALVNLLDYRVAAATDARDVAWFVHDELPELAFDHETIVDVARDRIRGKVSYQPIGFELLPKKFTLTQLQRVYEIVLGRELDKRNFRRKALGTGLLVELDEVERDVAHRAARLYRFDRREYDKLRRRGFHFEI